MSDIKLFHINDGSVQELQGTSIAIEWSDPRVLCIASDFTKYDQYAVRQIDRRIELFRYRRYGNEFMLFELVNVTTAQVQSDVSIGDTGVKHNKRGTTSKTTAELLEQSSAELRNLFEALKAFLLALGDDVQLKVLKDYFAFRRIKNFACVEVHPRSVEILVFVKVDPTRV